MNFKPFREAIDNFLSAFAGQHVMLIPNPGNAGDSLIAVGTYEAFERHGIKYKIISADDDPGDYAVFLGGGGNFVPLYSDTRVALEKLLGRAKLIVLLPHTIRGNEDLLCRLDGTCTIFCRDQASFDHVRANNPAVDTRLAHDMAFHVDAEAFLQNADLQERGAPLVEERLAEVGLSEASIRGMPSVDYLRLGVEARSAHPETDADVSVLFRFGVGPAEAPLAAWCFLWAINLAQHINTDRLHVAIGAALLGKPCTLRDNTYGKNSAVHGLSLASFSNIRLINRVRRGSLMQQKANSSLPFTIQVPVYNETAALEFSAYYFHLLGLSPRYILDSQRTPEAEDTMRRLGRELIYFENDKPFIENGYEAFARASPTDWILRLDCDELPSCELIEACVRFVEEDTPGIGGFERHQVVWRDGRLLSAQAERFIPKKQLQWRLFNRTRVRFSQAIHTPGVIVEHSILFPPEACAYHAAWQFLTWEDRVRKSDRYDGFGQPVFNRTNQLLPLEQADLAPLEAPLLQDAYYDWQASKLTSSQASNDALQHRPPEPDEAGTLTDRPGTRIRRLLRRLWLLTQPGNKA